MSARRVLITGAGGGLGAEVARSFRTAGDELVLIDRDIDRVRDVGDALDATTMAFDVADEEAWNSHVGDIRVIDVIVTAAGVTHREPLVSMSVTDFRRVIDVNVVGAFNAVRSCLPALASASGPVVVMIGSMIGHGAIEGSSAYVSSKWGTRGLAKSLALELAPHVRVVAVNPGLMATSMILRDDRTASEIVARNRNRLPLGRLADANEVANAVVWVASPEASYLTGSDLVVDGGWTAC